MTQTTHILGYPRIGANREMKKAVEAYWRKEISATQLETVASEINHANWKTQHDAGLSYVTVGDFSWYDHILDMSVLLGVVPERFGKVTGNVALNTIFCMARGQAPDTQETTACEMTKWFNTNYHYIVPEFTVNQTFRLASDTLFKQIDHATEAGYKVKPVIVGPLTYLWLGKTKGSDFNKLTLLEKLIPAYNAIFKHLKAKNIDWVQVDEPILTLDLSSEWQAAFIDTYKKLDFAGTRGLLTTYFGALDDNLATVTQLPVAGLHIDLCTAPEQLTTVLKNWPHDKVLSLGVINGRNIWRADLNKITAQLLTAKTQVGEKLWLSSSCSLLHTPVDLAQETDLDAELKSWLAFAKQKVQEIILLSAILTDEKNTTVQTQLAANQQAIQARQHSTRVHNAAVAQRVAAVTDNFAKRHSPYAARAKQQHEALKFPLFPTTTIGSFPQTNEIRTIRADFKTGKIDQATYIEKIKQHIALVIKKQEALDLDVLVHGEAERNDMVEYFGELLNGFAFTKNGWVQSYGSRCVKPPIIYGDVSRPQAMTVEWIRYAQSLTNRRMKGMLTGPVTILAWSFVRDDQTHATTALQIALALRDEVTDLEQAGIRVIQIDEPAFRESLPLRKQDWQYYLTWAVKCFRVASSSVQDQTQIHTHMCYSEFNDVIKAIAELDADVITLESSRSEMELLQAFEDFAYPNGIGPGVYDIHSPRVPPTQEMVKQLEKALKYVPHERLWVNPDCGLKTRGWPEVEQALTNMVNAAKTLRKAYAA